MSAPTPPLEGRGFIRARDLALRAAQQIPAYGKFLAANGIDPEAIHTAADFARIPPIDKDNYLRRHVLHELLWQGQITRAATWSTSSGSSGSPTYWPRARRSGAEATTLYSRILRSGFGADTRSTLLVVGFAMGDWIGGVLTFAAGVGLHERGARLSVIPPGGDADAILRDIAALGPYYDQVVLAAYPPFAKDVLDRAGAEVLGQDVKLVLAGESISEEFRDHLLDRLGKPGRPGDIRSIYGAAEAGILGHETATSIAVRRLAATDATLYRKLFGDDPVPPTFVEHDPEYRYFESDDQGRLLFTVDNVLPLVRYRIGDVGEVLTAVAVEDALRECGYQLPVTTSAAGCGFVTVRRRPDIATTFYAVKLYPDGIRAALTDPRLAVVVSGKFVLDTVIAEDHAQTLTLRIELRPGVNPDAADRELLRAVVLTGLEHTSTEYRRLREMLGDRAEPVISLHPFRSTDFRFETKHRWTGGNR
ncbi:phenylacetate--CoA ligase family protein [Nocardia sp. NPDC046763]|uniref:phenylacetate--CoA ligase family protein n=1 Tax=Nocardia sp. NPDC046763 TaxID=3155256 RepID=UPI0033E3CE0B